MKEIITYKCDYCEETFTNKVQAKDHEDIHKEHEKVNRMLKNGSTLGEINKIFKIWPNLPDHLIEVTKDNCFIIRYLQGCEKPAYRIDDISIYGKLHLSGTVNPGRSFGTYLKCSDEHLCQPQPKYKLFISE